MNNLRRYLKPVLVIPLLVVLAVTLTSCEDMFVTSEPEAEEEETPSSTFITTADVAILTVREHLLDQSETYQAKLYLADFYTACGSWDAESELFKDGTVVWYVTVSMTDIEEQENKLHWEQASWLVSQDGKVMPSERFEANALRIEADLQKLSIKSES